MREKTLLLNRRREDPDSWESTAKIEVHIMAWTEKLSAFRKIYRFWRDNGFDYEVACWFAREQVEEMAKC